MEKPSPCSGYLVHNVGCCGCLPGGVVCRRNRTEVQHIFANISGMFSISPFEEPDLPHRQVDLLARRQAERWACLHRPEHCQRWMFCAELLDLRLLKREYRIFVVPVYVSEVIASHAGRRISFQEENSFVMKFCSICCSKVVSRQI